MQYLFYIKTPETLSNIDEMVPIELNMQGQLFFHQWAPHAWHWKNKNIQTIDHTIIITHDLYRF